MPTRANRHASHSQSGRAPGTALPDEREAAITYHRHEELAPDVAERVETDRLLEPLELADSQYGFLDALLGFPAPGQRVVALCA